MKFTVLLLAAVLATALRAAPALEVKPGVTTEYTVVLSAALRQFANGGHGQSPVTSALCAVAVPANFDPARSWPVLVISATTDAHYNSSRRLMARFVAPALAAGWVVIAADPDQPVAPEQDSNSLRYTLIKAARAGLEPGWPGFVRWPVAFGGFSGGAKRSAWMAALYLMDEERRPIGVFQGGCNEPVMEDALENYRPDRKIFLNLPVFLSSGDADPIATPEQCEDVRSELAHAGFRHVRLEHHPGQHQLSVDHVTAALKWFTELAPPPAPAPAAIPAAPPAKKP